MSSDRAPKGDFAFQMAETKTLFVGRVMDFIGTKNTVTGTGWTEHPSGTIDYVGGLSTEDAIYYMNTERAVERPPPSVDELDRVRFMGLRLRD